ncbi:MAG: vWA domain-containing protein [bacterium]
MRTTATGSTKSWIGAALVASAASVALLATTARTAASPAATDAPPVAAKPRIDVAFVLDTTGSMGGLIEGAKSKIWSIANEMIRATPTPEIRIGLVAYRDRGDAYVTQVHDLSADIDAVYGTLRGFQADGGGDGPESVNQALSDAVTKLSWSQDRKALKLVFLVGDAPPHMDYPQDQPYARIVEAAVKKDLVIDTIQCGADTETARVWQEIARLGEGKFVALGQTGDMVAVSTPVDGEIAALARELGKTAVGYGSDERRKEVEEKLSVAAAAPAAVAADKATFSARGGASGGIVTGEGDLVADVAAGKARVENLPAASLPPALQAMEPEARADFVKQQVAKRAELTRQMNELVAKRDALLADERARAAASGAKDSFDSKVAETVREHAQKKGIVYAESK